MGIESTTSRIYSHILTKKETLLTYFNSKSYHHPSHFSTIGKSLFQIAHKLCDTENLGDEL